MSPNTTKTLVIHGGFDSFIEELYMLAEQLADKDTNIILFEGEGQGETLQQEMYFHESRSNPLGLC